MAQYVQRIRTESGDLQIDYQALANLPQSDTTLSKEGSFADAKSTGDAISELNTTIRNDIDNNIKTAIDAVSTELADLTPEDIGAVNTSKIVNNITTVEEGYVLDARQAYELNLLIQKRATVASYKASLLKGNWSSSAPYQQTVSVSGILLTDDPIVDIDMSGASTSNYESLMESWNFIGRITANAGSITAYCYEEKPTIDMNLVLKVVR